MAVPSPIVGLNERPSELLAVIKSPVVFNAFAVLAVLVLVLCGHPSPERWYGLGFVSVVTVALNIFAARNPRFLMYGPREYLRESAWAHEREMARLHATASLPASSNPTNSDSSHT
jgi:hypothetical protein